LPSELAPVRDDLRGGDIDLLVEVEPGQASIANEQRLRDRIAPAVQDLRTDIVLHERGAAFTPLELIALRDGVPLGTARKRRWLARPCAPRQAAPGAWRGLSGRWPRISRCRRPR
jgi:hypothetical protein